jgi:hypothetical protein
MYIYKIINKINGKWYIGKHNGSDPNYLGSGKILKTAIKKYGKENFEKIILEEVIHEDINLREQYWISKTNAVENPMSYNLASGGEGGDLSKFIPYDKIDYSNYKMKAASNWFKSLTKEQQKELHIRQSLNRSKGWFVSRVDDPTEIYVKNISKWCEEHGVDKSMPTKLNNPKDKLFQKQTKGWRIRRSDMPELPLYKNNRNVSRPNAACKGKTWKTVNGKRIWSDK